MNVAVIEAKADKLFNLRCNSCEGLYPNSMDVRFSKSCDNNCLFCIEREGIQSAKFDIPKMIESTKTSGRSEILILGGEPFLFVDNLLEYIEGIRPFVSRIYITSALPVTLTLDNPKVVQILDLIDGLNCSVHHYTDAVNNKILNTKTTHSRIDLLANLLVNYSDKIRVMGNLSVGGLDSYDDILNYVWVMRTLGAKEIKLNELQHAGDYFVDFEKVMGTKLPSPYAKGCQRDVSVGGIRVLLKRSCFFVEETKKAHLDDLFKAIYIKHHHKEAKCGFIVLYEDGKIHDGWEKEVKNA